MFNIDKTRRRSKGEIDSWAAESDMGKRQEQEGQKETERYRQKQTETDRDRQRQTETDRDRQRQTDTDRDRQRQTETDRYRQRQIVTDRDRLCPSTFTHARSYETALDVVCRYLLEHKKTCL